jgi:hypothetical protein
MLPRLARRMSTVDTVGGIGCAPESAVAQAFEFPIAATDIPELEALTATCLCPVPEKAERVA